MIYSFIFTIDAIKKIILEPEIGRFAKHAALQNRKLRREVTTISRMTHKNIVRYYQAWVEGSKSYTPETISNEQLECNTSLNESGSKENISEESLDSKSSKSGWWNLSSHHSVCRDKSISSNSEVEGDIFDTYRNENDVWQVRKLHTICHISYLIPV